MRHYVPIVLWIERLRDRWQLFPQAMSEGQIALPSVKILEDALTGSSVEVLLPRLQSLAGDWYIVDANGQSHLKLTVHLMRSFGVVGIQSKSWPESVREGILQLMEVQPTVFIVLWHWPSLGRIYVLQKRPGQEFKVTWKELGKDGLWTWERGPSHAVNHPVDLRKQDIVYTSNQVRLWTFVHPGVSIWSQQ